MQTLHLAWNEPHAALLDHRVDAVVARLPFPTGQLHVTVLYDEPRVLLVPLDHRLAENDLIASGQAVAIAPAGISPRPDLTTVPLHGVEPSHVVLATRAGDRSRLVTAFRKSAQACLTGPGPAEPPGVPPTRSEE